MSMSKEHATTIYMEESELFERIVEEYIVENSDELKFRTPLAFHLNLHWFRNSLSVNVTFTHYFWIFPLDPSNGAYE